jgi:small subunit ribosomal protein S16
MKQFGRKHRPYFRVCAMDVRSPRDGRVLEELGFYDPMIRNVDARAVLNGERISYWIGVGAQPSDKVKVLIKKYGANGTRLEAQQAALAELAQKRPAPPREEPVAVVKPKSSEEAATEAAATEEATASPEAVSEVIDVEAAVEGIASVAEEKSAPDENKADQSADA